ncbi:hypothetical protein WJX73_007400 [Symbiochloris irregularis]|uniref:Protein kinase domain-containing protein n=1 Tax=Symbiochloris irregularis TaxID=706552 RepID=A0AAW1NM89_9CHLO
MFEETLTYVTDGYMLSNAAILGAFGLVHWQQAGKAARGGWTGVYDQLLSWEKQAALMLAIILCVKTFRRQSAVALTADLFFYAKAAAAALCCCVDYRVFVLYSMLIALSLLLFPHPPAVLDHKVTLLTPAALKDRLKEQQKDGNPSGWLVMLYASWSPASLTFDHTFLNLARTYGKGGRLCFGKLDVSRWPHTAEEYGASLALGAQELPAVVLFEKGKAAEKLKGPDSSKAHSEKSRHDSGLESKILQCRTSRQTGPSGSVGVTRKEHSAASNPSFPVVAKDWAALALLLELDCSDDRPDTGLDTYIGRVNGRKAAVKVADAAQGKLALVHETGVYDHLKDLQGRYIPRVLQSGSTSDGMLFLATQYVQGTFQDWSEKAHLMPAMLEAILQVHCRGVAHGDIKALNTLFPDDVSSMRQRSAEPPWAPAMLVDFGSARMKAPLGILWREWDDIVDYLASDKLDEFLPSKSELKEKHRHGVQCLPIDDD